MIIGAIVEMGIETSWDSIRHRESIIKILQRFEFDTNTPPTDFDGIYAYTLVEYGISKPAPVLNFFRNDYIQEAYKRSFYENDASILEREAEEIIQWNQETGKLGSIDYDPRREFATFTIVFNNFVNYSRTPSEARRDQKLDEVLKQLGRIHSQGLETLRVEGQKITEKFSQLNGNIITSSITSKENNRVRWLHLSDFHVGKDNYGQKRLFKNLLEYIKMQVDEGKAPDMVFITGDIANKGQEKEYEIFYDDFYLHLYDVLPRECKENIFIVPGNHDVDQTQARAARTHDVLLSIPEFLDPTEEGLFERSILLPRFNAFIKNDFSYSEEEHWLRTQNGAFQKKLAIKGYSLGIIGINTAWLSNSDQDRHKLSGGIHILEEALEFLEDSDIKIVLGHHPLDWLLDSQLDLTRAILGKKGALYLHGHLHKGKGRYDEGAGQLFITLQAGAGFQARDDDLWVNGFLSCELDLTTHSLWVKPMQWSSANYEWTLDTTVFPNGARQGDCWEIHLPKAPEETPVYTPKKIDSLDEDIKLPHGWAFIDKKFLSERNVKLGHKQIISFFNGREPAWREALASKIPRREIVNQLIEKIKGAQNRKEAHLVLIKGAAGEGKTTAFLQTVVELMQNSNEWNVLWHFDTTTPFPAETIVRLPVSNKTWLIISDDAETIALRIYETVKELQIQNRQDIQFLLCARDTDWMAEKIPQPYRWRQYISFEEVLLRNLAKEDARKIVAAWSAYGKDGLQRLDGLDYDKAVQNLIDAARLSPDSQYGTFLGAMLRVRWGEELEERIEKLLYRLQKQHIQGTEFTLMDALAYIAAPHAQDISILSKILLSKVLGISNTRLKNLVLGPLGEEAIIATTGKYIYTRHQAIANTTLKILSEKFYLDIDEFYVNLVRAAVKAFDANEYLPKKTEWIYLSSKVFSQGNQELGIRLAQIAHEVRPHDGYFIVKLAQLYRKAGHLEQSTQAFRSASKDVKKHRGFYSEWGVSEGNLGNHAVDIWLSAYTLSDQHSRTPPDMRQAKISLSGLSSVFAELFDRYNQNDFSKSAGAAVQLGLSLYPYDRGLQNNQSRAQGYGIKKTTPNEAMKQLEQGVVVAWKQRETEIENIPAATDFTYAGLKRLLSLD